MNTLLIAAGCYSAFLTLVHIFGGGKTIAKPLLDATDIETSAKFVNYYCWHLVTFNLALMSALLILAAQNSGETSLAFVALAQSGFSFVWGVTLPVWKGLSYKDIPQGWFFAPVLFLTIAGLVR